jgi:ABC-2 type transport system permease protein
MLRYLRLIAVFARTELQYAVEYRTNLVLDLFEQIVIVVTSLAAVLVLFNQTSVINGWTLGQMIVLLGVYYLIQGLSSVVFQSSFERFMEHVRLGTLDFILIKPADSQFMISARHMQISQVGQVLMGLGLVTVGARRIGETVAATDVLSFVVTLTCGVALVYCLLLVLSTLSFWFVRIENLLAIFWSFLDAGRFPVDIYPGWLRVTLSTVVPIGVAVTLPAQAIAGRLEPLTLLAMAVGTVAVWLAAAWFWRQGLRNYTGASA